jgi:hypothetical protein
MAKRTRNLAVAAIAAAVLGTPGLSAAADTFPGNQPVPGRHVRSSNSDLIALIDQAAERSATFRSLVDVINRSDSIVFVEEGDCGHGVRACFVSVTAADSHRYMRVVVDTRKADWDLMGSIGHELRHTIEIIDQPSIRSNAGKYFFYAQNGTHGTATARETQAAVDAGNSVRDEVRQFTRHQSE